MKIKKSLVATLISACLCAPAFASHGDFHKKLYIGGAGGMTKVSPEIKPSTNGPALEVTDDESDGTKAFIGWDFRPHMAVELGLADLGEASIGPNSAATVGYEVADLSLVYHFYNLGGYERLINRRGLGAFWKLGVGTMDNESSGNVTVTRKNDVHAMAGFGLEYGTKIGLALRGEIEAFDEDALMASVGLLWRLGRSGKSDGGLFSKGDLIGLAADDSDGDGVPNNLDDCADTAADTPVTATGCAMFGGVLDGVKFASGSDKLTDDAQSILNDAADALLKSPNVNVEVQAHTDSQGAADYNLDLSKRRALAAVRYLMLRGVPSEQLQARAFGESKPLESNDTAEGREANRRVEFHMTDK